MSHKKPQDILCQVRHATIYSGFCCLAFCFIVSLLPFTSHAHGRESKKTQNNAPREAGAASGSFASTVLVTCSQSLTKEICE